MSKEVSFKRTRLGAIVCAVLMLAVLVLQFTPYWHIGEGEEQQDGAEFLHGKDLLTDVDLDIRTYVFLWGNMRRVRCVLLVEKYRKIVDDPDRI